MSDKRVIRAGDSYDGVEIRLYNDKVDEVVLYHRGRCVLHLEDLGANGWWMSLSPMQSQDWHINFDVGHLLVSEQGGENREFEGDNRNLDD